MIKNFVFALTSITAALVLSSGTVLGAGVHVAPIMALVKQEIRVVLESPYVIDAIKVQNEANADLDQSAIDRLDAQWRAEVNAMGGPLSDGVLSNPLSAYLKSVSAEFAGLFTEIIVMDNKGLDVGQSDLTSDYWQGDEAKWRKSFLLGPDAVFVDDVELDESTQTLQAQVSLSIVDPDSGAVIGAATFGIDVEALEVVD